MKNGGRFCYNERSTILTQDAAGVSDLVAGLKTGAAIRASQRGPNPIRVGFGEQNWLECETSGSTGSPKTVRRRPGSWIASFEITGKQFEIGHNEVYAVLGSLGHSLSLFASLEALHLGADLCVLSGMSPRRQLQDLEHNRATVIYATPTQLELLCATADRDGHCALNTVHTVFVGGGMLSGQSRDRQLNLFQNAEIIQFYGTSETSFISMTDSRTPKGSVGRPYPEVQLRLGEVGQTSNAAEIFVRSPYLFEGYGDHSESHGTESDGFFRTGEIGYQDSAGYLFLQGRADRMVTISDVNVHPEAIEAAVSLLPQVDSCAVVTVSDEKRGHHAVCFVVAPSLSFASSVVRRHCRSVLGASYVPKDVLSISELPRLPSGKPDLRALKKQIAEL